MFIKIIEKNKTHYILQSSIVRLTLSTIGKRSFFQLITTEIDSGTTYQNNDQNIQTTSSSHSFIVFQDTNKEAFEQLNEFAIS
jgi:uncharacterized protein YgiB involved in biofilm formation